MNKEAECDIWDSIIICSCSTVENVEVSVCSQGTRSHNVTL